MAPATYRTPEVFIKFPWLRWVLAAIGPVLVWSLPLLAEVCDDDFAAMVPSTQPNLTSRCLAFRCEGYPACSDSKAGITVSSFISTPPATGLFALAYLYPLSKLSYIASSQSDASWGMVSLILFASSFGLFMVFNCYYYPQLHGLFQDLVMAFGMWHFFTITQDATSQSIPKVKALIWMTILAFVGVTIVYNLPGGPAQYSPYLYYPFEALGLTFIALVPAVFDQAVGGAGEDGSSGRAVKAEAQQVWPLMDKDVEVADPSPCCLRCGA